MSRSRLPRILLSLVLVAVLTLLGISSHTGAAQDAIFVTNTPAHSGAGMPVFATNTPSTPPTAAIPTAVPTDPPAVGPASPVDRYGLRLWTEADFNALMLEQIRGLRADRDSIEALQMLQYEWQRRFPGAPRSAAVRETFVDAFMNAPRGAVDVRPVMRGAIEDILNAVRPQFDAAARFTSRGLSFELNALNIDNAAALDAVVRVSAPAPADPALPQFELIAVALGGLDGSWRVPPADPDYPAAPIGAVASVRLEYAGDITGDALAELVVSLDRGALNRELHVLGWRGDRIVSLLAPGDRIQFGELRPIAGGGEPIVAYEYQISSPRWDCIASRRVELRYAQNYLRPLFDPTGYLPQPTLACTLATLDPLYEQPLGRAIASVEALLDNAARDETGFVRGRMALAMLYALNGQTGAAVTEMSGIRAAVSGMGADDDWIVAQADAFLNAAAANLPPLAWCGAMEVARAAAGDAICAVDEVLARLWTENPPGRGIPLAEQIAALGGRVIEQTTVREVGRLDRQLVRFELGLEHLWSFAPVRPETYSAERVDSALPVRPTPVDADLSVVDRFAAVGDARAALAVLETEIRAQQAAGVPVSAGLRYGRALALDLLGDRAGARAAYYDLWRDDPASPWGRAAAAHLELR
jgi:hypothetical protein